MPNTAGGVHIGLFNRRAGKTQIGRAGQRITQVFGKTVHHFFTNHLAIFIFLIHSFGTKAVLRAVRLIHDHHDIAAVGQLLVHIALIRLEFLNGRKDHATRSYRHLRQILSSLTLLSPGVNFHPDAVDMRDEIGISKLVILR